MSFNFKSPNCGNEVIADECKFCSQCGSPMEPIDSNFDKSEEISVTNDEPTKKENSAYFSLLLQL